MTNERTNLYYDPSRNGLDTTIFKGLSWTPTLNTGVINLNTSSMIGLDDFTAGDLIMSLTIPVLPTAWDSRIFGFSQVNNRSFVGFNITDNALKAQIVDSNGVSKLSDVITWDSSWTATNVNFRILWSAYGAKFYINDVKVADITNIGGTRYPLSIYFNNANADVMSISNIQVLNSAMNRWGWNTLS